MSYQRGRLSLFLFALLWVVSAAGCGANTVQQTQEANTAGQPPGASADGTLEAKDEKDDGWKSSPEGRALLKRADSVLVDIEKIRGLSTHSPVKKGLMVKEELYGVLMEKLAEEQTDLEIENEAKVLRRMGLFPADVDYKEFMLKLFTEQIAGFYDDDSKALYILEGQDEGFLDEVFSHELFHAVQDQRIGIDDIRPESIEENADRMTARTALIEGDAVAVMIDYGVRGQGASFSDIPGFETLMKASGGASQGGAPMFDNAPLAIRRSIIFPYIQGVILVYHAKKRGGWEGVNGLYLDPPDSTEQLLHPERYFTRDAPQAVNFELPARWRDGHSEIYDNVNGELGFRLYFEQHLEGAGEDLALSEDAAEGWDGDRLKVFEGKDGHVTLFELSVWDSAEDAEAFAGAIEAIARLRYPAFAQQATDVRLYELGGEWLYVEQRGEEVLYIEGLSASFDQVEVAALSEEIWASRALKAYAPTPTPVISGL